MRSVVLLLLLGGPALAQDARSPMNYPGICCEPAHCAPVPCDELIELKGGHVVYTAPNGAEITVARSHVQESPNHQCHICYDRDPKRKGPYNGFCAFTLSGS